MKKIVLSVYRLIRFFLSGYGIEKVYPVNIINKFIFSKVKSDFAVVQGHKMFLGEDSLKLSIKGVHEEITTNIIKKIIKNGDIVLDIGAHIGYFTLIFAKLVGSGGLVFAFEPNPQNFFLLEKNIRVNSYDNVIAINKGIYNKKQKMNLYLNKNNSGDNRLYNCNGWENFFGIDVICLDDYFKNWNRQINFIKIDIQGAEGQAFSGGVNLLRANKKITIISEFWPLSIKRCGIEPLSYLKFFLNEGFELFEINERTKSIYPTNPSKLLIDYNFDKESSETNLLLHR